MNSKRLTTKATESLLVLVLAAATFLGCGKSTTAMDVEPPILRESQAASMQITDIAGAPIKGAKVLIGSKLGQPFPGNVVTTDANGNLAIPAKWTSALSVSILADGYVRTTYLGVLPDGRDLQVRKLPNFARTEVSGITSNYGALAKDGFVDVGLLLTPVTRSQLLNFQAASFISPLTDTLKLPLGNSVQVPTNVSIPKQKENYIISVTLDKPVYRIFLEPPYDYRLLAAHVRFPLKTTIDGFNGGKNVFDLLNNFELMSVGYRDVGTKTPSRNQDIAVGQVTLAKSVTVNAPNFDASLVMLTGAFAPMGPLYFPSDLKQISSGGTTVLKYPTEVSTPGIVLSFLRKKGVEGDYQGASADEYSSVLTPTDSRSNVAFLPMVAAPKIQANALTFQVPQAPVGVSSRGMVMVRSGISLLNDARVNVENRIPQWEIYSDTWTEKVELPELDQPIVSTTAVQRWEVMFLGDRDVDRDAGSKTALQSVGPTVLESVSHVTKNAVDF